MMTFIHNMAAIFIFVPFLAFLLCLLLTRKKMKRRAVGLSADLTTFLLFVSVPVSVEALWGLKISFPVYVIAIIIAIILLIREWKKSKDIEVLKFIRKTWRLYFLVLAVSYILIWITGLALTVISFS